MEPRSRVARCAVAVAAICLTKSDAFYAVEHPRAARARRAVSSDESYFYPHAPFSPTLPRSVGRAARQRRLLAAGGFGL
jgi:hypothetical protein